MPPKAKDKGKASRTGKGGMAPSQNVTNGKDVKKNASATAKQQPARPAAAPGVRHDKKQPAAAAAAAVGKKVAPSSKVVAERKGENSRAVLLREILSMGGEASDLDLLGDVLSGSEDEDADDAVKVAARKEKKAAASASAKDLDESKLLAELQAFMTADLKIDPKKSKIVEVDDEDGEDEGPEPGPAGGVEDNGEEDWDSAGSEEEDSSMDDEEGEPIAEDHAGLDDDLADEDFEAFVPGVEDEDAIPEDATKYGKEDASQVRDMVSQMLKGQTVDDKLSRKLLCEPVSQWHAVPLPPITRVAEGDLDEAVIYSQLQRAQGLYEQEVEKYNKSKSMSSADKDFIGTILKSGTVTDKVSAVTLLVQESPLHTLSHLRDQLVNGMARKKARREAVMAIDSVKDLMLGTLLPNRKLKYFRDQPLQSPDVKPIHLVSWYFEDGLKKTYYDFIKLIEELARDPLLHVKNKMIQYIFDLLAAKPEQEQNLLALLTNKLGDQDRKLASKAAHMLSRLLLQHPVMKLVVIKEVERLLFRPNISDRARYYAITFLNQIVFSHKEQDVAAANRLVEVYFAVFDGLGKRKQEAESAESAVKKDRWRDAKNKKGGKGMGGGKGKHSGGGGSNKGKPSSAAEAPAKLDEAQEPMGEVDGIDAKMMAALLTGVNRAFPFAKLEDSVFDTHMATLFRITHIGTFNTSIQSLSLIFQVQSSRQSISDRFYRTLYETLVDLRLYTASKQAMYLNLLFRSMKADTSNARVKAFIKRLVQICAVANVPFVCAALFLIGEVAKTNPGIWSMVNLPEDVDDDDVEKFVDAPEEGDEAAAVPAVVQAKGTKYDGRKRDPLYSNADSACLWELSNFATHFHPTVSLYAQTLLSGESIVPPANTKNYDPLQNHTLQRFLDRFVFKNPKKVESAYKGASLMQPRVEGLNAGPKDADRLVSAARKRGVVVQNEDVGSVALDDVPVHLRAKRWVEDSGEGVPVDEAFFYQFFKQKHAVEVASGKNKTKKKPLDEIANVAEMGMDVDDDDEIDEDDQEIGEDEVWNAMRRSAGFADEGDEEFSEDDEDDEELDDANMMDGSDVSAASDASDGEEVNMEDVFKRMDGMGAGSDDDDDAMAQWAAGDEGSSGAVGSEDNDELDSEDDGDDLDLAMDDDEDDYEDIESDDDAGGEDSASFANWISKGEDDDLSASDDSEAEKDGEADKKKKKKKPSRMAVKAQALGYSGSFFNSKASSGLGAFASAEDFEKLLGAEAGGIEDDGTGPAFDEDREDRPRRPRAARAAGAASRSAPTSGKRKRADSKAPTRNKFRKR
ncbi:hypothetical protein HKX48_002823 [Thoreauomyces humboldtii]|nr:hypothetical protein HKX48_002823 [Thoreauomyces humboldtii]